MNRFRIILSILCASLLGTSCSKSYTCHCDVDLTKLRPQTLVYYDVKARNRNKAVEKCSSYNDASVDKVCTIQ